MIRYSYTLGSIVHDGKYFLSWYLPNSLSVLSRKHNYVHSCLMENSWQRCLLSFENTGIPLADSNLRLMVTLELFNEIKGFQNWAGTFGKNPLGMGVHVFRPLIINFVSIWGRFYNVEELWINKKLLFDYFNY